MKTIDQKSISTGFILLCFCFVNLCCCKKQDNGYTPIHSIEKYRELRTEKLNKPRPVIHNNDGCDVVYFPINERYSVKNLLDKRTSGLIDTDVSTLSISTNGCGFGHIYNTKVGEVLLRHGFEFGDTDNARNITVEMIAEGTDILQVNIDFARKNGFEMFWSNRHSKTQGCRPVFLSRYG
jgi:hypothetical protein